MAVVSVTCTKIVKNADGSILIRFGKREREFRSIADMTAFVAQTLDRTVLEAICMRLMLDRQPALGNPAAFEGKSLQVDTSVNTWGTII